MKIILTHEQADFDALASLLGAHYLQEEAIPVLPRKMNRNVRAFVTLYGGELPFVEARDLPNEPVDEITLVDTQSPISIKGTGPDTAVHVIDHHPIREDFPTNWTLTVAATGANATILVDSIREREIHLGMVQATLLLLGIYEDTGSCTYSRTTARDLRAASFLMEQGANLTIANDFLNHPLTMDQQILYDRLYRNAETLEINGHSIVLACENNTDIEEEYATIVHKLRDFLDPDAIFVLITTRSGVQLIARSSCDQINVADVAIQFGGGGHDRAAAGMIKNKALNQVKADLIRLLPDYVHPAVTVQQIMSSTPQLLKPNTSVDEALQRMQRFGYEGFPVVKQGKIIGLLTRRAVDRAIAHKLNLKAESIMEAGEYYVEPDDSIERLQIVMTDSGWGQIPVLERESGKIIGIVTRTDLLKILSEKSKAMPRHNISKRLEASLSPARLALLKIVAAEAFEINAALYIVGGFVRDILLEQPSLDFDLVVEGDAIVLARRLAQKYTGRVTSHSQFRTAKWLLGDPKQLLALLDLDLDADKGQEDTDLSLPKSLDFVTARTEFYTHPTALPTVEKGSIKLDLHRRDFTINTLALRLDGRHYGELLDYWGGGNDIRHKRVRVLHSLSFVDDPTRILRAVRFEKRLGFKIEKRTLALMKEAANLLVRVSGDRIRHEMDSILAEKNVIEILQRLDDLALLSSIETSFKWDDWMNDQVTHLLKSEPDFSKWRFKIPDRKALLRNVIYSLFLLRITEEDAKELAAHLKFPANLRKSIWNARRMWNNRKELYTASISRIVEIFDDIDRVALYTTYIASNDESYKNKVEKYITGWQNMIPSITGRHLQKMGIPPGPDYRSILKLLRDAWLNGDVKSVAEESILLDTIVGKINHGDIV
ncbi:MAG: CBS domain-containing protein [Anaerolineales bacterium]|nr:CBS domain-containing protein [Anaerolineales bacterium]